MISFSRKIRPRRHNTPSKKGVTGICSLVCGALLLTGCQSAQQTNLPLLLSFDLEGNAAVDEADVLERLALQPTSRIPFFGERRFFDPSLLETDLLRILRYYETRGYYSASVVSQDTDTEENGVRVRVRVEEGPPALVGFVNIEGFPLENNPNLPLVPGEIFEEGHYEESKRILVQSLLENGYPFAQVTGSVIVQPENREATVNLTVEPGRFATFGEISVAGNQGILAADIIRVMDLPTGAPFQQSIISNAQRKLYDTGAFSLVNLAPDDAMGEESNLTMNVRVAEAPFQSVALGGGFGFDPSQHQLRGRIEYSHRNFFGSLRRFNVQLRPAYSLVPTIFEREVSGFSGDVQTTLFQPDIFHTWGVRDLGFTTSLTYRREFDRGYTVNTGGTRFGFIWPATSRSTIEFGYNWEAFVVSDVPPPENECLRICYLSFLDQRFVWDRRDHPVSPTTGYYLNLSLHEAGLGGDFAYIRISPEARWYVPASQNITLATRVSLGKVFPRNNQAVPVPRRFFAGGSGSHRGFGQRRLSPYLDQANGTLTPIGGSALFLSSLETRYSFTQNFSLIGFVDAGDVATSEAVLPVQQLNYAAGVGLRYNTPVAPIRVDLGYRLNTPDRFAQEGRFVPHLTLGDAF